jgi:hypothetical protein
MPNFKYIKIDDTDNWEPEFVSSLNGGRIIITYAFDKNDKFAYFSGKSSGFTHDMRVLGLELIGCDDEKAKYEIEFASHKISDFDEYISCDLIKDDKPLPEQCNSFEEAYKLWEKNPW